MDLGDRCRQLQELNKELEKSVQEQARELEQTKQKMAEGDRRDSAFLANISHELRTPMNSILGYTNMLLKGSYGYLNEQQQKSLRKVYENAHHLMHILNDLLALSHLELGRMELRMQPVSLKKIVLSSLVSVEPLLIDRILTLEHEIPSDLPAVLADEVRIKEVLINLLNNAIKFTQDHGKISIGASQLGFQNGNSPRQWVEVRVQDTGIGIKKEDHERIFDQFLQLNEQLRPDPKGSGLGLFISKKLVEMHQGRLRVESKPSEGSVFCFTLPVAEDPSQSLLEGQFSWKGPQEEG